MTDSLFLGGFELWYFRRAYKKRRFQIACVSGGPISVDVNLTDCEAIAMAQWILKTIGGVQEGEARAEESVPLVPPPAADPIEVEE